MFELGSAKRVWIDLKYKHLPSFCYLCGLLGHMRRECDLADEGDEVEDLSDEKLPFGEWMRASPMKKTIVELQADWHSQESKEEVKGDTMAIDEVRTNLVRVAVLGTNESVVKGGDSTMTEINEKKYPERTP
ncbi:hypothetical protein ACS0TY_013756 [Phlomoides rotata]